METKECTGGAISALREKYADFLCRDGADFCSGAGSADRIAAALVPDGRGNFFFPDVDYADANRNVWRTAAHYERLETALVRGGRARLGADPAFREKILGAVRFWLDGDFRNPNWWHNEIGMPMHLGNVGLLLGDALPEDDRARLCALVARGSLAGLPKIAGWTGANLIWGLFNTVRHALLAGDDALLADAAGRLARAMEDPREGIQPDGAFYQHGPRLYSGGYGVSFTFNFAQLIYLFDGTRYAFPNRSLERFLRHVLDGQRRMMQHGYFDPNAVGRELTRRGALRPVQLLAALRLLSRVRDLPRRDELIAFLADAEGRAVGAPAGAETAYFPSVSLLTHHAGGVYYGVKCLAPGQYDAEICNSEGELCYNMSYGTRLCLMRRGDEYFDLCPIFDWAHLPGTVAREETDAELLAHRDWWKRPLPNGHVGGRACGARGIVFEKPEHDGISLFASYFVFDGHLCALGAGLRDEKAGSADGKPLTVTLDQCRPVCPERSSDGRVISNGGFTYRVHGDGPAPVAGVRHCTGSWKRNSFEEDYAPVEGDVFLAFLPLPCSTDGYAFTVSPRGEDDGVTVLSNTAACQAIRLCDGTVMAVFHEDGALETDGGTIRGTAGECVIR